MLTFIAGVTIGSTTMLVIMSLMTASKRGDQRIELSISKES
ncbi:DUF3789 domain-containing protein [Neobacillus niacini]|nr:DUF3789 domain-containing protein [Neobacillus niacini]MEC1522148.1 DUF3789 domain-containing protein [Neobacillus niacini]